TAKLHGGAIDALGSIGRGAQEAAPELLRFAQGDDPGVATAAGLALARILPANSKEVGLAIPALVQALKDKRSHVRSTAGVALGTAGPAAVPALIRVLSAHAEDADAAWQAAAALEFMGLPAEPAVSALGEALGSRNEKVLIHSAGALGAIGPAAAPALPALRKLMSSHLVSVRAHAAHALGNLGPTAGETTPDLVA